MHWSYNIQYSVSGCTKLPSSLSGRNSFIHKTCPNGKIQILHWTAFHVFKTVNTLLDRNAIALPYTDSMKNLSNKFNNFFDEKMFKLVQLGLLMYHLQVCPLIIRHQFLILVISSPLIIKKLVKSFAINHQTNHTHLIPFPPGSWRRTFEFFSQILLLVWIRHYIYGDFSCCYEECGGHALTEKASLKNYRPVSNTAFLSKIIEKTALIRVSEHIDNNELHRKFQSAYKTGHSTETALLRIKSDIMQAMDNGQAVFMVLLDLSTHHLILLITVYSCIDCLMYLV